MFTFFSHLITGSDGRDIDCIRQSVSLQINNDPAEVNVFLVDGSLIDEEYFCTLESQTTLILQKPGEKVLSG